MNILERYIGRNVLAAIFVVLFMLISIAAIIRFIEQFRYIQEVGYDTTSALIYTLLHMVNDAVLFFPMAVLLGVLLGLGAMANANELTVMLAAGFSKLKISLAVLKTVIPFIILSMFVSEKILPHVDLFAKQIRVNGISGGQVLSVQNGVWVKSDNQFIYVGRFYEGNKLNNLRIYTFDDQKNLNSVIYANNADYKDGVWILNQVTKSIISTDRVVTSDHAIEEWETVITPDKLGIATLKPESLAISGLSDYKYYLQESGQEYKRIELVMWRKILQPLSITVMLLLAISFIFGPLRSVTTGARILIGICSGFLFYVTNEIFGPASLVYNLHPFLGAVIPSICFLGLGWYLLVKKQS